jgi:hypothetical protein
MPNPLNRAVGQLDGLLARLAGYSTRSPRVHSGVRFNPADGLGGTPDAANIDYRGFQAYMTPAEFLGLNPARNYPYDHVQEAIRSGQEISTPMLMVDRLPKGEGWKVVGHEGRGRMMSLAEQSPDSLFPVGVHPYGEVRARNLTPDDLFRAIKPEMDNSRSVAVPRMAILNKTPYVRPGLGDDEAVVRALLEMLGE